MAHSKQGLRVLFQDLSLPQDLIDHLNALGFHRTTPIQAQAIPPILTSRDLIAQAKTGSGKTLAFLVPLISQLQTRHQKPEALIIAPTRELCEQIATELKTLGRYRPNLKVVTLYGGTSLTKQVDSLSRGADVIIGTPGRLLDHLFRETLELSDVHTLVLDEADRMLDMGFSDDILKIVAKLPQRRQSLLFSATYPDNIAELSHKVFRNPTRIQQNDEEPLEIEERAFNTHNKDQALITVLQSFQPSLAVVFCNTKRGTHEVSEMLDARGFDVATLNGDLEQYERQEMLLQFANGSLPVLVATDVASRGLDIEGVELVINYDLPQKAETYTHRIGRTGRADAQGIAITLCNNRDIHKLPEIKDSLKLEELAGLHPDRDFIMQGKVATLSIEGGKKKKLRAGDILGTLCKEIGINPQAIGKINVLDTHSYVAIHKDSIQKAYHGLKNGKIKKRKFRVWWI